MDNDFRRFFCEIIIRPLMVLVSMSCIFILHDALYYFVWRVFYGAYSVRVNISLNLALWYGIFPAFIMMALLPLRLMKGHLLLILLITALLFGFGGSTHLILCILLSFYWLLGCGLMLFMKYVVYRQVAVLLKISPL
ncbi:hypothetical protein HIJ87_05700 [Cronobacter malonaticus]|uniref:hypothetical protein n=2 Tax=Cronobacter malonaticus TaxID=413503 RepID=UPI000CFB6717|nr:hypothetical protein [Cronobacter malonaticus]MBF4661406.1 hypothetical protein [Cronobacter malonaticus]MBF4835248.1 hypothetical protein [Cronobacter malonaticus]MBF4845493.1 hypothetical protein [Cronobacter malonaticus]MBF4851173.1 hypothetical protein [Cronobacter malonaticus]MBF4861224.1 hypothetical protein [Cronobacter malonaticus]